MEELIMQLRTNGLQYAINVLAAILIFVLGKWVVRIATNLLEKILNRAKVDPTLSSFLKNFTYMLGLVFVLIAAVNKLGVETTSMIAMLGAAGLAVGLALQGSLANFAAGVLLIVLKPFRVGDYVEIHAHEGIVRELQIFNTVLVTFDNRQLIIPNAKVTDGTIINYTNQETRRVDLVFGISYKDSIKDAKAALQRVVARHPKVLKDPAPRIAVSALADSSVNLVCRPWVRPADYWDVYYDVIEQGKLELEAAGMTIPFPQRDIHVYQEK